MDADVEQIMATFEGGYTIDRQGYRLKDGKLDIGLRKTSAVVLRNFAGNIDIFKNGVRNGSR